ncbi:pesticin C-terminus-like muramidase [Dickeya zeae]|nr:pesticin C-terminus-like muramidase [Dickeya zeae]
MAAPLSRLTSSLQGFTSQSLLKSATPKPVDNTGASPSRVDSISLPTAPAQKINTPIPAGRSGTIQRALATGAAYKQGNIEGLDDAHTRALIASTAATESAGGKLDIRNSAGYLGRYQAGASWLAEAGLIAGGANAVIAAMKADGFTNEYKWGKSGGMTRFLKNKNNWKNGLDYDKYLSSAEIQDNAFKTNSDKAYAYLVKKGVIKPEMTQNEIAGILKARHIGGIGGAIKAAKNIEGAKDANGTSALKYKNDLADGNVFIESYQSGMPKPSNTDANFSKTPPIKTVEKPVAKTDKDAPQRAQSGRKKTPREKLDDHIYDVIEGKITFKSEGIETSDKNNQYFSRKIHYPGGVSGVTIGRGYDMKYRSTDSIIRDLTSVGIDENIAKKMAKAAHLQGDDAKVFVEKNRNTIPEITVEQQVALFNKIYPEYEKAAKKSYDDYIKKQNKSGVKSYPKWDELKKTIREIYIDMYYQRYKKAEVSLPFIAGNEISPLIEHIKKSKILSQYEKSRNRIGYLEGNQ